MVIKTKDEALDAVRKNGMAFKNLSHDFKQDPDIIKAAIEQNAKVFELLDSQGQAHFLAIVEKKPEILKSLETIEPDRSKYDHYKNFYLKVLEKNAEIVQSLPKLLRKANFYIQALASTPKTAQFLSDPDVFQAAMIINPEVAQFLPSSFINEQFFLKAMIKNPEVAKFLPSSFINEQFFLKAINVNPLVIKFTPPEFFDPNYVFQRKLLEDNIYLLRQFSEYFPQDKYLFFMETVPEVFRFIPKTLAEDKAFVLEAVSKNPKVIAYLSNDLKNNKDFALSAVAINGKVLENLPSDLREDQDVYHVAVNQNKEALDFIPKDLEKSELDFLQKIAGKQIDIKKLDIKVNYEDKIRNTMRNHVFSASLDSEKYQGLNGDALKKRILSDFKEKIIYTTSEDELNTLVDNFKKSDEFQKCLAVGQSFRSRLMNIKTSSVESFEEMVADKREQLRELGKTGP